MILTLKPPRPEVKLYALGIIYLVLGIYFLSGYLILDAGTILGLLLAPYLVIPTMQKGFSWYSLPLAILVSGLAWVVPGKSGLYFSLGFGLLFLLESIFGKLNKLPLFLVFILSPLFQFVLLSFGFPIRLWLSQVTAAFLTAAGFKAEALGNILVLNSQEFSVDPACMGLNMLHISFLAGLFMLAYLERQNKKQLTLMQVSGAMLLLVGFNILANLIRILVLAIFKIMPDQLMHEGMGLLCFALYIIVPFYYLTRFGFRYISPVTGKSTTRNTNQNLAFLGNGLLLLLIFYRGMAVPDAAEAASLSDRRCELPGFTKHKLPTGVIQFQKAEALVYVKPIDAFYRPEHTPLICWIGSGYSLEKIKVQNWQGYTIYTGILRRKGDLLYTAWWFDNGQHKTIEQVSWRWQMLKGKEKYSLVNISTETENALQQETKALLKTNIFN